MTLALVEPSLALQTAIRQRLVGTPSVVALVQPVAIFDRSSRPERFPCIVIGEGMTVRENVTLAPRHFRAFATIHLWTKTDDLATTKGLAWAVARAIRTPPRPSLEGWHTLLLDVDDARYMRDPKPELSHAVMTVSALVEELPQ